MPTYAIWATLGMIAASIVRSREVARLGYDSDPRHGWVGLGAMIGAVVGSKAGLVLFGPLSAAADVWSSILSLDFEGKTVLGAIAGGWVSVEITKALLGISRSTGDGFAEALLVGQGIGRIGCLMHGCCYGAPTSLPFAVSMSGPLDHPIPRHPVQLYESMLVLLLALYIRSLRGANLPEGHRFRRAVAGYALIRALLDPLRGDGRAMWGPLSAVQWACLLFAAAISAPMLARERQGRVSPGGR